MARFLCCTIQAKEGGEPVWINIDLVSAIQVDQFGMGSKITFAGEDAPHFFVQEKPHEIFERPGLDAKLGASRSTSPSRWSVLSVEERTMGLGGSSTPTTSPFPRSFRAWILSFKWTGYA